MSGATTRKPAATSGCDLQPPTEPELREAVQQNDQRPIAGLDVMQALIADVGVSLAKLDPAGRHQAA